MRAATFAFFASLLIVGAAAAAAGASVPGAPTGDGLAVAPAPAGPVHPSGAPDDPESPLATFSYYSVVGMQLQPRVSGTTFGYDFNGCLHLTAGTDNRMTFPLLIPDGSQVKYLRIYYDDTNASVDLTAWLTRYDPGSGSTDLTSVTSSGSAGFGTALSPELTENFDSALNYSVIVANNVNNATVQICGVRVAYYAPLIFRDDFETGNTSRWSLAVP